MVADVGSTSGPPISAGRRSPIAMPTYLIDSDRREVHSDALAIVQV